MNGASASPSLLVARRRSPNRHDPVTLPRLLPPAFLPADQYRRASVRPQAPCGLAQLRNGRRRRREEPTDLKVNSNAGPIYLPEERMGTSP
ncbi:hypothetical protein GWI33_019230 [Rhynchophorus ferrugineus]|uniref:Uncharacterized protein n=1 Tax=Rhynchophorus ferrugineus TaxID=354439 RepID=A0A834HWG9_RHYFE|nr:hypothetical protein GWI33_019230 [Rhynchophorus ferrugineus]